MIEKRKHPRVNSFNLSYVCTDENGTIVNEGMGRTLNVSESGILLESHFAINVRHGLSLTIAFEDELIDIKGKVVHCRTGKDGKFETGVQFIEIDEAALEVLRKFIKVFHEDMMKGDGV